MAGTQTYINPAFPSEVGAKQTPRIGVRAELFTYRATGNYYEWAVPASVYYAKVTLIGGSGANTATTTGGTSSFGTLITATGGVTGTCGNTNGTFSVSTTRDVQFIGTSYNNPIDGVYNYIMTYGINGTACGGSGTAYLKNLVPGTIYRITIGVSGGTGGQNGVCLIEY